MARDVACVTAGRSIGKFSAFAQAVWQGGRYIDIGPNVAFAEPIVVEWDDGPYPRLVVYVAPNARASIVEKHSRVDRFRTGLVDIFLDEGAHLTYVHVQNAPRESIIFSHQRAHLERDAKLVTLNFAMGGRLARADVEVELRGQGAESDMLGLIFGENDQQFDYHTLQGHRAPDTRSDLLFKSALDDKSHSTYTGVISIGKDAPRSEAYQANRNLLLSSGARADTEPKLEILIDDVARCTHGATIGPVDDEQLFYLRSRGLDADTAARVIVDGFFQEVFQKAGDDRATAGLADLIAPHIGRLGSH
jgi:Fe-S cluster assembly protein SufD